MDEFEEIITKFAKNEVINEDARANENKLSEEIGKLKARLNNQEIQLSTATSRLLKIQSLYQALDIEFTNLTKSFNEKAKHCQLLAEQNRILIEKLQKTKLKLLTFRKETASTHTDYKEMTRSYMNEKANSSRFLEQNNELRHLIQNLEEMHEKAVLKIENLNTSKSELSYKLKSVEDNLSYLHNESSKSLKSLSEELNKSINENSSLRFELKRKSEELILEKAQSRKQVQEICDLNVKIKKAQDQEEFYQKLVKNSENEIKRISDKFNHSVSSNDDKDLKITTLNSELIACKNSLNLVTADLKKLENSYRLVNLDNYSLQSKIDEIDRFKNQDTTDCMLRDEYNKLLMAYRQLNEEFKQLSQIHEGKSLQSLGFTDKTFKTDDSFLQTELEKMQTKFQGVIEEKEMLERKIDFLVREKQELEGIIEKNQEEIRLKYQKIIKTESIFKELQKYKSECMKLEADQNSLKKELEKALSKLHRSSKAHSLDFKVIT